MAIKHLLSVSLEDGCLTRFQLANLAATLSTDDKHQHASNTKYTQKNYQSSASVGVDLCDRVISILEKTFLILILVLQCLFQRIHFPSLRVQHEKQPSNMSFSILYSGKYHGRQRNFETFKIRQRLKE